jgi:hypothetical protein
MALKSNHLEELYYSKDSFFFLALISPPISAYHQGDNEVPISSSYIISSNYYLFFFIASLNSFTHYSYNAKSSILFSSLELSCT